MGMRSPSGVWKTSKKKPVLRRPTGSPAHPCRYLPCPFIASSNVDEMLPELTRNILVRLGLRSASSIAMRHQVQRSTSPSNSVPSALARSCRAVPATCWTAVEHADVVQPQEAALEHVAALLTSLRFTHQVKFSISLWNTRSRNVADPPLHAVALLRRCDKRCSAAHACTGGFTSPNAHSYAGICPLGCMYHSRSINRISWSFANAGVDHAQMRRAMETPGPTPRTRDTPICPASRSRQRCTGASNALNHVRGYVPSGGAEFARVAIDPAASPRSDRYCLLHNMSGESLPHASRAGRHPQSGIGALQDVVERHPHPAMRVGEDFVEALLASDRHRFVFASAFAMPQLQRTTSSASRHLTACNAARHISSLRSSDSRVDRRRLFAIDDKVDETHP